MTLRNYTNTSVETTLTAGIDAIVTSLIVADATGYPVAPFAIVVDPDVVASEEVLLVTAKAGPIFAVTRAYDGTTGKVHSAGATVIHAAIAADFVDGQVAGADTQVQFNDGAGAFGADAGLTYTDRELTIAGDGDKTTPLLTARSGDFRASGIVDPGIPQSVILYTAVAPGTGGNAITIHYDAFAPDQVLTVTVVGSDIAANLATDSGQAVTSTANDVLAAINGDMSASALVIATNAPGNDGSGLLLGNTSAQLSGGALAANTAWIDERGVLNIQLQAGLGLNAINVRDPNGDIVAHLDNDGGLGFSSDRFLLSQHGDMFVDTFASVPLAGNATFRYSINGFGLMVIAAGGGYGVSINSPVPGDILLNVAAGAGQTGDLIVAFDEDFNKVVRVLPRGAVVIAAHATPDDADIATGQMALWFDQTPSASKFMIKAKDSDGTVVTGEVALS